jgi:hypothetical protein
VISFRVKGVSLISFWLSISGDFGALKRGKDLRGVARVLEADFLNVSKYLGLLLKFMKLRV